MTYAEFLLVFLMPPIAILLWGNLRIANPSWSFHLKGIGVLCVLAFVYTTPWDNYLVAKKVWWYGADRVLGTVYYVPIEEYTFFFLQTIATGLWTVWLINRMGVNRQPATRPGFYKIWNAILLVCWVISVVGLFYSRSFYLSLILSWAIPVVMLQFGVGGRWTMSNMKLMAWGIIPPTLYLWGADAYAISQNIWTISKEYTLGYGIGVLPLEEMVFFLVTNVMVVQGLVLFDAMKDQIWVGQNG